MNRDQVHPWWHHFFQLFQHPRPRKSLALDQLIEELRLVTRDPVFRTAEKLFGAAASFVALRNLMLQIRNLAPIAPRVEPPSDRANEQQQRENCDRRQRSAPAHPELPRIFVRLAREIDFETHIRKAVLPLLPPFSSVEPSPCSLPVATRRPVPAPRLRSAPVTRGRPRPPRKDPPHRCAQC